MDKKRVFVVYNISAMCIVYVAQSQDSLRENLDLTFARKIAPIARVFARGK